MFISYAREDESLILPVAHLLRAGGAAVFLDLEDIPYGEKWESALLEQLRASERILVFWSINAANSEWVRREYLTAIGVGLRVVPVPLDETPLPAELATFQALTSLVPLVYQARRALASRTLALIGIGRLYRYGSALALLLFLVAGFWAFAPAPGSVVVLAMPESSPAVGSESSPTVGSTFGLVVLGAVILFLVGLYLYGFRYKKLANQPERTRGSDLQVAIFDAVFGANAAVSGA